MACTEATKTMTRRDLRGRSPAPWVLLLTTTLAACASEPVSNGLATVEVTPGATLLVGVGSTVRLQASVFDSTGRALEGRAVAWASGDGAVVTVDDGGLVTAVGAGVATVTAQADGVTDAATVEVYIPPEVASYEPGTSYFGRREYIEYVPGELPLVISAPHGGDLEPEEMANRTYGTMVRDSNTRETLLAVREAFLERTGAAPHIVISHLRRTKLDPNRDSVEAAQGDPYALQAWREFQGFIETGSATVVEDHGTGLYLDLHGHGHDIDRVELGYLLSANDLNRPDDELDSPTFAEKSSVRALFHATDIPFSRLIRGPESLGGLLGELGVRSVPSPGDPRPGSDPYFSGGHNTLRHGSRDTQVGVSGIQLELHFEGVRDTPANRSAFGLRLAAAVELFVEAHYGSFAPVVMPGGE